MSLRGHTVGHPSMTGSPPPTFGEKRKGSCGHYLSRYNPDDLCRPCARQARLDALENPEPKDGRRRAITDEILAELPGTAAEIGMRLGITTKRASDVLRRQWTAGRITRTGEAGHGRGPWSRGQSGGYYYAYPEEP